MSHTTSTIGFISIALVFAIAIHEVLRKKK